MLKPVFSGQFKRDYKLAVKRGCDPKKLEKVISMLCSEQSLPDAYRDHALTDSKGLQGYERMSYPAGLAACLQGRERSACFEAD